MLRDAHFMSIADRSILACWGVKGGRAGRSFEVTVDLGGPLDVDVDPGVHGLADHTKVNYAIGVLLARGRSYEEADEHLARLAERLGTLEAAADHLLTTFNV